jgi:hypothetical protein
MDGSFRLAPLVFHTYCGCSWISSLERWQMLGLELGLLVGEQVQMEKGDVKNMNLDQRLWAALKDHATIAHEDPRPDGGGERTPSPGSTSSIVTCISEGSKRSTIFPTKDELIRHWRLLQTWL